MREDFHKLLTERERTGSGRSYRQVRRKERALHLVRDEEGVDSIARTKVSMTRPYGYEGKQLNENLSPLWRFLKKNVNRLWNKVYAEIHEHFRADSAVKLHIYQHLEQAVELNPQLDAQGRLCSSNFGPFGRFSSNFPQLYVDAKGFLRQAKGGRPWWRQKVDNREYIPLDNSQKTALVKVAGIWYRVSLAPRKVIGKQHYGLNGPNNYRWSHDVLEPEHFSIHSGTVKDWPVHLLPTKTSQLCKRELKKHGLKNDSVAA